MDNKGGGKGNKKLSCVTSISAVSAFDVDLGRIEIPHFSRQFISSSSLQLQS